jgi:4-carboxymuconolactone decarboxylase
MKILQGTGQRALGRAELDETVTHLAFYAGWPAAATAARLLDALPPAAR